MTVQDPAGWPDPNVEAALLDSEFGPGGIGHQRSDVTREAVKKLEDITARSSDVARKQLVTMALTREAIPATAYGDKRVARLAAFPDLGRVFAFAVHNARVGEGLHTRFMFFATPKPRRRRFHLTAGTQLGMAIAYIQRQPAPGPAWRRAEQRLFAVAASLPVTPSALKQALKPLGYEAYFAINVDFEYAAALGWRVIDRVWSDQKRGARHPNLSAIPVTPNALVLTGRGLASGVTVSDMATRAWSITEAEKHHAKLFDRFAHAARTCTPASMTAEHLGEELEKTVDPAFVPPEYRGCRPVPGPSSVVQESEFRELWRGLARLGISPTQSVCLAVRDCQTRHVDEVVEWILNHPGISQVAVIGGEATASDPRLIRVPDPPPDHFVYELEAGCVTVQWPTSWRDAHVRMTLAGSSARSGDDRAATLGLAALSQLCGGVPEWMRRPFKNFPRADVHALIWLLDLYPPQVSIVVDPSTSGVRLFGGTHPIPVDRAVCTALRLDLSPALKEAMRWFNA